MPLNDLNVTRFPEGVTDAALNSIFSSAEFMDPTRYHCFMEDFDYYVAADWTVTEVGVGSRALTDADGGALLITNAAADDDHNYFNKLGESFLLASGKKAFFRARFAVSDATQSDFIMGLQITDVTPLDVTDGVFFQKDDGDADIDFHSEKDNVQVSAAAIATAEDATFMTLEFFWDGISRIYYGKDGTVLGYIEPSTSLPDDEVLTVSFAIQNGEAVAKTMTLDYIFVANER